MGKGNEQAQVQHPCCACIILKDDFTPKPDAAFCKSCGKWICHYHGTLQGAAGRAVAAVLYHTGFGAACDEAVGTGEREVAHG